MGASLVQPLPRERGLILALLLAAAAAAWVLLGRRAGVADDMAMSPAMGMTAPVFLTAWVLMMVAMMFPTAAPMILMFARISAGKRRQGRPFVPTWVFVGAYLTVWIVAGAVAYAGAVGAERLAERSTWLMDNAARLGGVLILLAGVYQLSPLKRMCLSKCRTPLAFVVTSWRDGFGGAFRMGLEHGLYCLGCCWLLFVILFPLGMMNVAAMVVITALIFAEKSWPIGVQVARLAALVLISYGVLVLLVPAMLPATM